jgi:hypothetical protein
MRLHKAYIRGHKNVSYSREYAGRGLFKVLSKEPKGLLEDYLKIMKGFT